MPEGVTAHQHGSRVGTASGSCVTCFRRRAGGVGCPGTVQCPPVFPRTSVHVSAGVSFHRGPPQTGLTRVETNLSRTRPRLTLSPAAGALWSCPRGSPSSSGDTPLPPGDSQKRPRNEVEGRAGGGRSEPDLQAGQPRWEDGAALRVAERRCPPPGPRG